MATTAISADTSKFLGALKKLEDALDAYGNKARFTDNFNPNAAPLSKVDISISVRNLHDKFDIDWSGADAETIQSYCDDLTSKIEFASANLVPNLHSSPNVSEALIGMLYAIDNQMTALMSPDVVDQMAKIPLDMRRTMRDAKKRLDKATESIGDLEEKVKRINEADANAKNLPDTLADLEVAASDIEKARNAVLRYEADAKKRADDAETSKNAVDAILTQTQDALKRINAALGAATSEGLAREFRRKAAWLNITVVTWTAVLIGALWIAVSIGAQRFPVIVAAAAVTGQNGAPQWGLLLIQMLISILSLGAPVWLAWVATKQIGERFRLAEDYAYKAALSSAYEGYRNEAADLDPLLRAQLFSIALSRLDEMPLRLIDKHVAGSPMHELLKSSEFKEAIKNTPGLRDVVSRAFGRKANAKDEGEPRQTAAGSDTETE